MATTRRRNITTPERAGRVVLGLALVVLAGAFVASGVGALGVLGALLLAAFGLDLVVTGAIGYCPLYARLGYVPPSFREPQR